MTKLSMIYCKQGLSVILLHYVRKRFRKDLKKSKFTRRKGEDFTMKKKIISALLCVAMVASMLVGCGGDDTTTTGGDDTTTGGDEATGGEDKEATGSVYYLNFKPEQADQWVALAEAYTEETGVKVDVVTAASGTYESTLKSEMAKEDAHT